MNKLIIISILISITLGCSKAKLTTAFKESKKNVEDLTIIKPYIEVIAIKKETRYIDTTLTL